MIAGVWSAAPADFADFSFLLPTILGCLLSLLASVIHTMGWVMPKRVSAPWFRVSIASLVLAVWSILAVPLLAILEFRISFDPARTRLGFFILTLLGGTVLLGLFCRIVNPLFLVLGLRKRSDETSSPKPG